MIGSASMFPGSALPLRAWGVGGRRRQGGRRTATQAHCTSARKALVLLIVRVRDKEGILHL